MYKNLEAIQKVHEGLIKYHLKKFTKVILKVHKNFNKTALSNLHKNL